MIINKRFGGIYYGEDVDKELEDYMEYLYSYTGGEMLIGVEEDLHEKVEYPDEWNIPLVDKDGNPTEELLALSPVERDKCIAFWTEEIRRVRKGYKSMCGLQYLYFNYGKLRGGRGEIEFRRHDNVYFHLIDSCLNGENRLFPDNRGWGIIEIGRRRSGKSSKFGNFIVWMLSVYKEIEMLLVSKSEEDAKEILRDKAKHLYNNLPMPLKPAMLTESSQHLHIGIKDKDSAGNRIVKGRDNTIYVKPCVPEAVEGKTPMAILVDEIGKIPRLDQAVNLWLPALADAEGFDREGLILLTGVAGDMLKFPGAEQLWKAADGYRFIRWFSAGWSGMNTDDKGNENIEGAVRRILQQRNDILNDSTMSPGLKDLAMKDLMAQYPLTIEESFQSADIGGKFNEKNIGLQLTAMEEEPFDLFRYDVEWAIKGIRAKAIPNQATGKVFVLEPPIVGHNYISSIDPYAFKQREMGSSGSFWMFKVENNKLDPIEKEELIMSLAEAKTLKERRAIHLKLGHLPVAFFEDRNPDTAQFAEQCIAIQNWYWIVSGQEGPPKCGMDRNPSNTIEHYIKKYPDYVMNSPIRSDIPITKQKHTLSMYGIDYAGGYWSEKRYGLLGHYTTHYCDRIYFEQVLKNMKRYDESSQATKYDDVDSLGNSLITASDQRIRDWNRAIQKDDEEFDGMGLFSYKRA